MLTLRTLVGVLALPAVLGACKRGAQTPFSGQAAYRYAGEQVAFGPRVPGTPAHEKAGDWIVAQMRQRADTVIEQRFVYVTPKGDSVPMRNILARFRPAATARVLYVTHWDTRPVAENDPNPANRNKPIPGANDGASGVGLFVALGDLLKQHPPSVGVDLLFVDGEDWGNFDTYSDTQPNPQVLIGSTYFAMHPPSPTYHPLYGVLWDMIGDKNLDIYQEAYSLREAPEVVNLVWNAAGDLGYRKYFIEGTEGGIIDDQVPFLKRGYHVIDVIDIDYGPLGSDGRAHPDYHHTLQDTMDKISAHSLQVAGDVAYTLVK